MVLDIYTHIAEQLKATNPYLDVIAVNVIKMKNGEIVNLVGTEKTNFSPSDIVGFAGYLRLDPNITYSRPSKKHQSCAPRYVGTQDFRMVLFSVNQTKKADPVRLENKISGDLIGMGFGTYTGKEKDILISVKKSNLDFSEVFKSEIGSDYNIPSESVIIAINCSLSWTFTKEDCIDDCNVWEEVKCQIIN